VKQFTSGPAGGSIVLNFRTVGSADADTAEELIISAATSAVTSFFRFALNMEFLPLLSHTTASVLVLVERI
jgi:hypothetical protein